MNILYASNELGAKYDHFSVKIKLRHEIKSLYEEVATGPSC
jgi:hypothetical protein